MVGAETGSGANVVLEAVNIDTNEPLRLCEWTPGDIDTAAKRRFQEIVSAMENLEFFTDAGRLYVGSADRETLRSALAALQAGGLFPGDWPGVLELPPPPPPPPPPPVVQTVLPKRSGWSCGKVIVAGMAAGLTFALAITGVVTGLVYYFHDQEQKEVARLAQRKLDLFEERANVWRRTTKPALTVTVRNECPEGSVWVALRYLSPDQHWVTQGWFEVGPGQSTPTGIVSQNSNLYYHAFGAARTWDGTGLKDAGRIWVTRNTSRPFVLQDQEVPADVQKQMVWFRHRRLAATGEQNLTLTCKN